MEKSSEDRAVAAGGETLTRRRFLALIGAGLGATLLGAKEIFGQTASPAFAPQRSIANGAYIQDAPWIPTAIDDFTSMVGTAPKIVGWFESWSDTGFSAERMDVAASRDATPLITWQSWDHRLGTDQPKYALRAIAHGDHDAYVRQWAKDAADYGKPVYLRFDHEMNVDSFPWGVGANGNTAAEYVDTWRHVHGIFRQEGATNVRWVWSPNVVANGSRTLSAAWSPNVANGSSPPFYQIYPGDEYVDWVGLDGYNWGTSQSWSRWQRFTEVFEASYDELAALTDKPMMIGEMASTEAGGNIVNGGKPNWIRRAYLNEIPSSKFERIEAVMWFHQNKETNWRVDSSAAALEAYKEAVSASLYQGRLP